VGLTLPVQDHAALVEELNARAEDEVALKTELLLRLRKMQKRAELESSEEARRAQELEEDKARVSQCHVVTTGSSSEYVR
jgi:hypothetical protein